MPKTSRPSGNWGDNQKKDLRDLVDANEIDLARKDASYDTCGRSATYLRSSLSSGKLQPGKALQSNACKRNYYALTQNLSWRELGGKVCV
jgi:hypothetical protein